jgi:hypothetical protein
MTPPPRCPSTSRGRRFNLTRSPVQPHEVAGSIRHPPAQTNSQRQSPGRPKENPTEGFRSHPPPLGLGGELFDLRPNS